MRAGLPAPTAAAALRIPASPGAAEPLPTSTVGWRIPTSRLSPAWPGRRPSTQRRRVRRYSCSRRRCWWFVGGRHISLPKAEAPECWSTAAARSGACWARGRWLDGDCAGSRRRSDGRFTAGRGHLKRHVWVSWLCIWLALVGMHRLYQNVLMLGKLLADADVLRQLTQPIGIVVRGALMQSCLLRCVVAADTGVVAVVAATMAVVAAGAPRRPLTTTAAAPLS